MRLFLFLLVSLVVSCTQSHDLSGDAGRRLDVALDFDGGPRFDMGPVFDGGPDVNSSCLPGTSGCACRGGRCRSGLVCSAGRCGAGPIIDGGPDSCVLGSAGCACRAGQCATGLACDRGQCVQADAGPVPFDMGPDMEMPPTSPGFVFDMMEIAVGMGGISVGANHDDLITRNGDITGCGQADYTHPNGTRGIDNAMGRLVPILDMAGDESVAAAYARRLSEGRAIMLLELDASGRGALGDGRLIGSPRLSAGRLAPGQTFERGRLVPFIGTERDSEVTAELDAIQMPFALGDRVLRFRIYDVHLTVQLVDGEPTTGVFSGVVDIGQVVEAIEMSGIDTMGIAIEPIIEGQADLAPDLDGICNALSIVVPFHAVAANIR